MTRSQFTACMKGEPIPEAESESIFDRFAELEKEEQAKKAQEPGQPSDSEAPQGAAPSGEAPAEEAAGDEPASRESDSPSGDPGDPDQ